MTPNEFKNLLDKYSQGECSPHEENLILEWYENIKTEHATQPESLPDVELRLWSKVKPLPSRKENPFPVRRMAAVFALLFLSAAAVTLSYYYLMKEEKVFTAEYNIDLTQTESRVNKEKVPVNFTLPDGSEITLQPGSEIVYSKNFLSEYREVYLSGEAFFNVTRDTLRPFLVFANEVVTKVLGTSFTVEAYKDASEVTVAVRTGKVSVFRRAGESASIENAQEEIILVPNQRMVFDRENHALSKKLVEKPEIILSKPTLFEMKYDGATVSKIFEVLEENYGIDIQFDEDILENCILTTSMSDEGFYERIEIICKAIDATYEIKDTVVLIKSEGCQ